MVSSILVGGDNRWNATRRLPIRHAFARGDWSGLKQTVHRYSSGTFWRALMLNADLLSGDFRCLAAL
jgi:hypothetical protein